MEGNSQSVEDFFRWLWNLTVEKHNQGIYNTVCLVVLLALPLLVFLTAAVVCCHWCCCRHKGSCCCYCCGGSSRSATNKKNISTNNDDLWISVKTGPTTPDRVAMGML